MKTQILEKNGLPKPLGMLMIVLIIGLACFIQLLFTQPVHAQKRPDFEQVMAEKEPEVQIEAWMTDPGYWNNGDIAAFLSQDPEPEITIEGWMTDFSTPAVACAPRGSSYEIEPWMFDETMWVNPEPITCQ